MRIIVTGPVFPDSFARNIIVTLQHMGHEVYSFSGTRVLHRQNRWVRRGWQQVESALPGLVLARQRKLVRMAREIKPDLVLVSGKEIFREILAEVKAVIKGPMVCWYTDSEMHFGAETNLAQSAFLFDIFFTKGPHLVAELQRRGVNARFLPEACNPVWHRRVFISEEDRCRYSADIAGIGTLHEWRAQWLEPFCARNVKIWGDHIPRGVRSPAARCYTHCFVAEEEKAKALLSAQIVINPIHESEREGVNCSLFEIAGCGAFQIALWKPTIADNFCPGTEIVTFGTKEELSDEVDYYLAHPAKRKEIADRAYGRAHAEHTYERRLQEIFRQIGIS
jgi:spore maturation protein CgeB